MSTIVQGRKKGNNMPIVVTKHGHAAQKVSQTPISREEHLQKYIHDNPDAIPLDDLREDLRLCVLAREFPTSTGPIDALAIDDEGAIYIIETKLYKNPDKRFVIAQVLDYGAALWNDYRDYSQVEPVLDRLTSQKFGVSFCQKIKDLFGLADDQLASLLERFRKDLGSGRFTFIILMDHLHDQLKALLSFINQNSRFLILGCEMDFYKYDDLDILIPKLYGVEAKTSASSSFDSPPRKKWDEGTFFDDTKARLTESAERSVRKLFGFATQSADHISWGTGTARGSFNPKYEAISARSIFTVFSDGVLQINLGWLNDNESTLAFRGKLRDVLAQRADLTFSPDCEERYTTFQANQWTERVDDIIDAIRDLIRESSNNPCG